MAAESQHPLELVYKQECPYCRTVAAVVNAVDVFDNVATTPIESPRGEELVTDAHGEFIESPHLFTESLVYYGVTESAVGLCKEYVRELLPP